MYPKRLSNSKTRNLKETKPKPNIFTMLLLGFGIIMVLFGIIMVFDASVYKANEVFHDQFYFLKLHLAWIFIGLIPATLIYLWDYRKVVKLAVPILISTIGLLVLVLFFGSNINGAKRWFSIGPIPIQPAEFAKLAVIIYLSSWLSKERRKFSNLKDALKYDFGSKIVAFGVILAIILLLIMFEPDMGTTMVIAATAFSIFYISGNDAAHTVGTISVVGIFGVIAAIAAAIESYRLSRVKTFLELVFKGKLDELDPGTYQIKQILIGIGSSGFWGKGFGQSRQRFGYLVENTAFTDSIFAVILEELGFIGCVILVGAWVFFLFTGLTVAQRAPDKTGKLLAAGITIWLCIQAFLNMGANVAMIPLTGIPLPFFTYGGSNTIVTLIGFALLLNISKFSNKDQKS